MNKKCPAPSEALSAADRVVVLHSVRRFRHGACFGTSHHVVRGALHGDVRGVGQVDLAMPYLGRRWQAERGHRLTGPISIEVRSRQCQSCQARSEAVPYGNLRNPCHFVAFAEPYDFRDSISILTFVASPFSSTTVFGNPLPSGLS